MTRFSDLTLTLLRIVAGLLFIHPGALKIFGWFGGMPAGVQMTPLIAAAGWIEIVCGSLILVGLFTRPAAFLASGEMAVAYFKGHFLQGGFWPIQNHGEQAVLFCFLFLHFSTVGAGPFSLDALRRRERSYPRR